jgi:hypothetical protein
MILCFWITSLCAMALSDAILLSVYVSSCRQIFKLSVLTGSLFLLLYCSFVTVQRSGCGNYIAHWDRHGSFLGGHSWAVTPVAETGNLGRGGGSFARTRVSWLCNSHLILNLPVCFACKFIEAFILFFLFCYFLAETLVALGSVGGLAQNCSNSTLWKSCKLIVTKFVVSAYWSSFCNFWHKFLFMVLWCIMMIVMWASTTSLVKSRPLCPQMWNTCTFFLPLLLILFKFG